MLKFCDKNKGAISVFLTLILLPVLLLGGLTTDAARIYASKVVISDAGEMAMNAALAQYDFGLLDEYGLFAMSETPENMEDSLAKYFTESLNGSGIAGAEDYDKILDLVQEEFSAINLEASKLYKTDVEKQQIVEYMKYRAPVCITELLLEKLDVLKETKQITDATEAQLQFAEDMEKCQDAMEDAKEKLDELNSFMNSYPSQTEMNENLGNIEYSYKNELATSLLMLVAASKYSEKVDTDGESAAKSYVEEAEGIDLGNPISSESFEAYIDTKYYADSARKLNVVVADKRAEKPDSKDAAAYEAWEAEMKALEELQADYENAKRKFDQYLGKLKTFVKSGCIDPATQIIQGYYEKSAKGIVLTINALDKLEIVQKKLEDAKKSWQDWSDKTEAISGSSQSTKDAKVGMQTSVNEYVEFFGESGSDENKKNLNDLDALMEDIKTDKLYFQEVKELLLKIKYFECSLATTSADQQYMKFKQKAESMVDSSVSSYEMIMNLRTSYAANYVGQEISTSNVMMRIHEDPFYKRLQKYCEEQTSGESEAKKKEANQQLKQGQKAAEDSEKTDESYPNFKWTLDGTMPSVILAKEKEDAQKLASISGDGNVGKSGRKKALADAKKSISEASNFLTKLDNIISEGATNLYIAEYAMQMFSYYTVNKQVNDSGKVEEIPKDQVISLSGHVMSDRKAYRAEVEYILWGNPDSRINISNTVMTIFGIRLLLNSIFSFTNGIILRNAREAATLIAGSAPYLVPIIQAIIQFGFACVETSDDIGEIKEGYGVTLLKDSETWTSIVKTAARGTRFGDNTKGVTMDYSEYLRIFLNVNMLGSLEATKLARIADCIQLDAEPDITKSYTMLAIEAKVKARTTFMRKISDMGSRGWTSSDDNYTILYQSVLGY